MFLCVGQYLSIFPLTVVAGVMQRRTLLSTLTTAGAVVITGCSGSETRSGEPETNFSTEGNDSELIRSSASSLTLTAQELPGSGWDQDASNANQRRARQRFSRVISGGHTEGVLLYIQKEADVSAAKESYALIGPEHLTGQAVGVNDTRELEIGVESVFYSWYDENAGEPRNLMKIRDANVLSRLQWIVIGAEEEPVREDPVTIQRIGSLGITVHRKWRSHRDLSDR